MRRRKSACSGKEGISSALNSGLTIVAAVIKDETLARGDGGKMAKFFEYQGKEIFKESGIPMPEGMVVKTPEDPRRAAEKLAGPVVVKAQVWAGGNPVRRAL